MWQLKPNQKKGYTSKWVSERLKGKKNHSGVYSWKYSCFKYGSSDQNEKMFRPAWVSELMS